MDMVLYMQGFTASAIGLQEEVVTVIEALFDIVENVFVGRFDEEGVAWGKGKAETVKAGPEVGGCGWYFNGYHGRFPRCVQRCGKARL